MVGHNLRMHVPAKVECAIQAAAELAAAHPGLVKAEQIANALPRSVCDLTDDPDAWISH